MSVQFINNLHSTQMCDLICEARVKIILKENDGGMTYGALMDEMAKRGWAVKNKNGTFQ